MIHARSRALKKKEDESGGNCSKFSSRLQRTTFQIKVGSRSPLLIVTQALHP